MKGCATNCLFPRWLQDPISWGFLLGRSRVTQLHLRDHHERPMFAIRRLGAGKASALSPLNLAKTSFVAGQGSVRTNSTKPDGKTGPVCVKVSNEGVHCTIERVSSDNIAVV